MPDKRELVESFGQCYRFLNRLALNIENNQISSLLSEEEEALFSAFIIFLRSAGAKEAKTPDLNLENIFSKIENILKLTIILKVLKLVNVKLILETEKSALVFKLKMLIEKDDKNTVQNPGVENKKQNTPTDRVEVYKPPDNAKRIFDFIKNKGIVDNVIIFSQFPDINARSVRRKLESLTKSGAIVKMINGKKINYRLSIKN